LAGLDSREDDELQEIELTYSILDDINQTRPAFGTPAVCIIQVGRKLLVSLAMEGKFSREGLQSLDQDDDMLTAMARELVTENGVGECAAAVWRQIQAENSHVFTPADTAPEPSPVVDHAPLTTSLVPPAQTVDAALKVLKFGSRPASVRPPTRRRGAPPVEVQFPLF